MRCDSKTRATILTENIPTTYEGIILIVFYLKITQKHVTTIGGQNNGFYS